MKEKKYYWLKLTKDFFKDKAIKKLRKMAGGDTFTIIYLKMLLEAISQNGILYFEGVEDTFHAELALEIDENPEDVRLTLAYLQAKGLVKVLNEYEFNLMQCDEMVGSETDAARRKRRSRNKQKILEDFAQKGLPEKTEDEIIKKPEEPKKLRNETQDQILDRLMEKNSYEITDELSNRIRVWLKYKTERKEKYQETGMNSLLRQLEKKEAQYGTQKIVDLIDLCMSNQWKGIIYDRLETQPAGVRQADRISNRVSEVDSWV